MDLASTPDSLTCTECGEEITGTGYVPVREREEGAVPHSGAAVCDACGFNEVGFAGCAPELTDLVDSEGDSSLVRFRATEDGIEPLSVK